MRSYHDVEQMLEDCEDEIREYREELEALVEDTSVLEPNIQLKLRLDIIRAKECIKTLRWVLELDDVI